MKNDIKQKSNRVKTGENRKSIHIFNLINFRKMKRIKIYAIGLAILITSLGACNKENLITPISSSEFQYDVKSAIDYSSIQVKLKGFNGRSGSSKILVFKDMDTFLFTLNELERQAIELDNAFVEHYKDLEEEAINEKEEEIGFNEKLPLYDFVNKLGFKSLYEKIDIEEEEWLNQEEPDWDNDPDNHFVDIEELRTLLNVDGEVQIGNVIYKLTESGYFEILDNSLQSLKLLDVSNLGKNSLPTNTVFVGDGNSQSKLSSSDCRSWRRKSDKTTAGSKRIKWVVSHWSYPWGTYATAKTKNYKKKGRRWKKYRTDVLADVYGFVSGVNPTTGDADCSVQSDDINPDGNSKIKKARSVTFKIRVSTSTKSGWIKGYHYGAEGVIKNSTLTF